MSHTGTDAVTTAPHDTSGFAVSPELAADAYARLSELQGVVGEMVRQAKVLGRKVPLGGGYADEVGDFMAEYGVGDSGSAVESLIGFGRELEGLKQQITSALERYDQQDDAAAAGVDGTDCVGG
jgi:hypothetical protein